MANDPLVEFLAQHRAKKAQEQPGGDSDEILARADAKIAELEALEKADAEKARQPAQMPATARKGDSGLLPVPEPVSFGGAMRAIGDQFVKEGKAIPAAFNDAFSMGAIPAIQEAKGGSLPPGSYQQAMEAGPVGTVIGQTGGILASGGAGLAKPLAEGGQMLASGLRKLGAFVSPTVEKAVASGVASGAYGAADAAIRGGTPEQVLDAGMSAGTLGAGVPLGAKAISSTAKGASNLAGKIADKITNIAEKDAVEHMLDKVPEARATKATSQLEKSIGNEVALDPEEPGRDAVLQVAKKHGLGGDLMKQSIPKFADAVEAKKAAAGEQIGKYIEKAGQLTPGVRLDAIVDSFEKVRSSHAVGSPEYKAITQKIEALKSDYGDTNVVAGVARVPLWEVQDMASKAAKQGWAGVGLAFTDPTSVRKLGRQTAYALRQPLYDEINRVAVRNPSTVGSAEGFAKARARYADLSNLSDVAEAARGKTTTGKEGLFARIDAFEHMKHAIEGGALATASHQLGMPHFVSVGAGIVPFVKPAAHATNAEIAKLINAARGGFPARMYNAAAEQLNVSPEIAARIWQQFGPAAAGATGSQEALPQVSP